jgi:hypothetical protein
MESKVVMKTDAEYEELLSIYNESIQTIESLKMKMAIQRDELCEIQTELAMEINEVKMLQMTLGTVRKILEPVEFMDDAHS